MIRKCLFGVAVLIAAVWILSWIPFAEEIERTIPAQIYENDSVIGETILTIQGEKTRYIFRDDAYSGTFAMGCYEKSCREGAVAAIDWDDKDMNYQRLRWFYKGDFPLWETVSSILINEEMDSFAVMFNDGRIVASSREMYELFSAHISHDADRGATHIAGPIPAF